MATLPYPKPLSQEWFARQRQTAQLREPEAVLARLEQQNPHRPGRMSQEDIFELKELRKDIRLAELIAPNPVHLSLSAAETSTGTAIAIAIKPYPTITLGAIPQASLDQRERICLSDEQIQTLVRLRTRLWTRCFYAPTDAAEYLDRAVGWLDQAISVAKQQAGRFDFTRIDADRPSQ